MNFLKAQLGILIIVVLSYFSVQSLLIPGFFPMHDDTQPSRVYEMKTALLDGHFPVRWVPDLGYGYGYPIFNFYAPFGYYVGALISFFTTDVLLATKLMMMLGVLLAGVFMYMLGKEIFGTYGGIVSSIAYVFAPYHAVNIFVRGDVAEFWAYSFIPFIFYSVWKLYVTQKTLYVFIGAFATAALITSHNLTALMVAPFMGVFVLVFAVLAFKKHNYYLVKKIIALLVLSVFLSAFYWIPTFGEMRYTNVLSQIGGGADFREHFVCIGQLWNSPWGFGGSVPGCVDGMSFKIGKIHLILSGITIFLAVLLLLRRIADASYVLNPKGIFFLFAASGFLICVLLTLDVSKPIWEFIPVMAFFQYPWRLLILISFFSSLLCGFFVWMITKSISGRYNSRYFISHILTFILVGGIMYSNYELFNPQTISPKTSEDYISSSALKWKISKISDEYMPPHFQKPKTENEIVNDRFTLLQNTGSIQNISNITTSHKAAIFLEESSDIRVNIAYFPSWKMYLDNKEKNYTITGKGLIVKVPEGEHILEARFVSTGIQKIANTMSLIGFVVFILGIISSIKYKKI